MNELYEIISGNNNLIMIPKFGSDAKNWKLKN